MQCRPRKKKISYIVVHYTGVPDSSARAEGAYLAKDKPRGKEASSHFVIDAIEIVPVVPVHAAAFHCGDMASSRCGACNDNAIGIDLCSTKKNKAHRKASDSDWWVPPVILVRAAEFIAKLMKEFNIPLENVVRHYDVTGKLCPRPLCGADINSVTGISGDEAWMNFKSLVKTYL